MYRHYLALLISLGLFFSNGNCQKQYYVSTLAGDTAGMRNGAGSFARFDGPTGIATDTAGNIYVADTYNNIIRKINASSGMVTTLAGDTSGYYKGIDSIAGYNNGKALTAKFNYPLGLCVDKAGNVYVADTYNHVIRKIDSAGNVTTYAGDTSGFYMGGPFFVQGYVNGADSLAKFSYPTGVAIDTSGNIFVADNGNNVIREIWASTHIVTTVAGRGPDTAGYINGLTDTAEFENLFGIAVNDSGAIYVTQLENGTNAIRKFYKGMVTTYAGYDTIGVDTSATYWTAIPSGYRNGKSDTALFSDPAGLVVDSGNVFVADEYNNMIREVVSKNSIVSTLAGNDTLGNINGWCNSDSVEFYNPIGITVDKKGVFYVTDNGNNSIRKIALKSLVGINELRANNEGLMIYPNPSSGIFDLRFKNSDLRLKNIQVYNVLGERVYSVILPQTPKGALSEIDLSNQPNGVYFYRVAAESGELIGEGKLVIQK